MLSTVPTRSEPAAADKVELSEKFRELIAYEYRTCQMTFLMTKYLAEQSSGEVAEVWKAYHRLYAFNRPLYEYMASKFGVSNTPSRFTRFRGWISGVAGKYFPGLTLSATNRLANRYVEQLKTMRDEGPPEHRAFLDYVVAMEQVQIDFLADAVEGNYSTAGGKVDAFLAAQVPRKAAILGLPRRVE